MTKKATKEGVGVTSNMVIVKRCHHFENGLNKVTLRNLQMKNKKKEKKKTSSFAGSDLIKYLKSLDWKKKLPL